MKPIRDIVSREVIDDLWGAGYTILPRARHPDPFHIPAELVPHGRSYQWMHIEHDKAWIANGWSPVPASRHDGWFAPAGYQDNIELNGLGLFEKPKFEVDAERAKQVAAAHKQVDDWKEKWGGEFSGSVAVGRQTASGYAVETAKIGDHVDENSKTINTTTAIPRELTPYIAQIFDERDALYNDLVEKWNGGKQLTERQADIATKYDEALVADPTILKGPILNALLMPQAIENIRAKIKEEAHNGQDN